MNVIYCVCCGRPFSRPTKKGGVPKYCSDACRRQMAVRRNVWGMDWAAPHLSADQSPSLQGDD